MRTLVTGGVGFVGRHLARHLVECGDDVIVTHLPQRGVDSETASQDQALVNALGKQITLPRVVQTVALDVTDKKGLAQLLELAKPDAIYHLAALTYVPEGEKDPSRMWDVNTGGTINLLEAVKSYVPDCKVLVVSSSEVYGLPRPGTLPFVETSELRPITAYGLAKAAADIAAFQYSHASRLSVVRARPFSHTGPGQAPHFSISGFARQLAAIKLGLAKPVIYVGNLEAKRDFSDVADIVRGYREMLLNGKRGAAYNLCSGQSVAISDVLKLLVEIAEVEVEIQVDESRLRENDIPESYGSSQLAHKEFGWRPRIELEGMLHGVFAYWVESLADAKQPFK